MVNSQHSTKGKTYQSKERGFPEMMEQCLLLGLVGTGIMERPYLCTSSPVYIKYDTSLQTIRASIHWFLTLPCYIPGVSLIFSFLLNSATYLKVSIPLSRFFVFSRKFFISTYQIQLLRDVFFLLQGYIINISIFNILYIFNIGWCTSYSILHSLVMWFEFAKCMYLYLHLYPYL